MVGVHETATDLAADIWDDLSVKDRIRLCELAIAAYTLDALKRMLGERGEISVDLELLQNLGQSAADVTAKEIRLRRRRA
jgi:hypothetical protein